MIRFIASLTLVVGLALVSSVLVHLAVGTVVTKTAQATTALSIGLYITILSVIELVKGEEDESHDQPYRGQAMTGQRFLTALTLLIGFTLVSYVVVRLVQELPTDTWRASLTLALGLYITTISVIEMLKEKK